MEVIYVLIAVVIGWLLAAPAAVWLATSGLPVGSLAGTSMMGMTMKPVWVGLYGPEQIFGPISVLCFIVTGAILYPAFKAATIEPLDAMRYQ